MNIRNWNIESLTGYKPITTFYEDLSIADHFGLAAIEDTYKQVMREWSENVKYITEFIMALNWKSWEHAESGDRPKTELYVNLYYKASDWAYENLKGDDLSYFIRTTD